VKAAVPPEKIDLYRKVRALAERGAPGERNNARAVLVSLEQKYPDIRGAAEASPPPQGRAAPGPSGDPWAALWQQVFGAGATPPPAQGGGGFTGRAPATAQAPSRGPGIREAFEWTRDFLRTVVEEERKDSDRRALVEEHADVTSRYTDSGDLVIRLRVTEAGRRAMRGGASTADLWAVAQQVGKDVADEFVAALEEEAEAEAAPQRTRRR
jgi:hypothetical protein